VAGGEICKTLDKRKLGKFVNIMEGSQVQTNIPVQHIAKALTQGKHVTRTVNHTDSKEEKGEKVHFIGRKRQLKEFSR